MALAFSSSSETVIASKLPATVSTHSGFDAASLFNVEATATWIRSHGFLRVALQFPDELLCISVPIAQFLTCNTSADIVILADTSFGSCCVDEVAAEHYCVDALVHFGHACLSPTPGKLPVRFEFPQQPINVEQCVSSVLPLIQEPNQCVLLLYDTIYCHSINGVVSSLQDSLQNLLVPSLVLPNEDGTMPKHSDISCIQFGRRMILPEGHEISSYTVLYIGLSSSPFLTAVLMKYNSCPCICFDPQSAMVVANVWNASRALARRYYLVERVRDARRVGIIVGTLGVADYLDIAHRLETLARHAGKAVYRFVVGKLNTPKLANFADIDIFVLVACPENTLIDSKDFYQPVVTPFELEIACSPARQWTGKYEVDFHHLLLDEPGHVEPLLKETDMSLITGKLRHVEVDDECEHGGSDVLVRCNDTTTVATNATASNFFQNRSWQGLDPQLGKTPVWDATDGSKGIAMHYCHEPSSVTSTDNVKE